MIKGYELKNNNLTYEAEVWDKNGQTLFVPPLSSEIVKKIDETKLAIFLQDCITRGACHESKGLLSGKLWTCVSLILIVNSEYI